MNIKVIKRDGRIADFDSLRIENAIIKAKDSSSSILTEDSKNMLVSSIVESIKNLNKNSVSVEEIQDIVENTLIKNNFSTLAKEYILFRNKRNEQREINSELMSTLEKLTFTDSSDFNLKRENGNIDGDTAMGTMLRYGSESAKKFYKSKLINPIYSEAHDSGDIHIHDLDFFALTETCCQIDIKKLFEDGFSTGHGYLREPSNIISAAALACIAIQANQNEQHGGQSIPNFDYAMSKYVGLSYIKNFKNIVNLFFSSSNSTNDGGYGKSPEGDSCYRILMNMFITNETIIGNRDYVKKQVVLNVPNVKPWIDIVEMYAYKSTREQTYQAMEALIHNLNTMHSRAGAQIPFSSLNYGTDTSEEGRLVVRCLLYALDKGLGNGETPIFPIHIFKMKEGINYNPEDPNYDLWELACKVSAKRLFPNFSNLDAPFNKEYYEPGHPETEIAYMGCRTRVIGNVYDPSKEITYGRGNLSFTSINLPRLAIESVRNSPDNCSSEYLINFFFNKLDNMVKLVINQLLERFKYQCMKKVKNYPFMMGQGIWIDSDKLDYDDSVAEVLKHGSMTVGFIGLAECLKMLTGKHHGESEESQKLGLQIVGRMREITDSASNALNLNFAVMATPAEGLSGRFVKIDKKKYGIIPGVTDREYYTNSFHVPVYYDINFYNKIKIEAPYHALTNGGHITYIEYNGDPLDNLEAFMSIVRLMHDEGIGYGAINHAVDYCKVCGYTGVIKDSCPVCGNTGDNYISVNKLKFLKKTHPNIKIPKECRDIFQGIEYSDEDNKERI